MAVRPGRVAYYAALAPEKWADMAAFLAEVAGQGRRGNTDISAIMRHWRRRRPLQA